MTRTLVLLAMLASRASAQPMPEPIRFHTQWDAHNAAVRLRPANDTGGQILGRARRLDARTFEVAVRDPSGIPLSPWVVEARIRPDEIRGARARRGAGIGAMLSAAAIVGQAAACYGEFGAEPSCGGLIITAPAAALLGTAAGAVIGHLLPVREWQRVDPTPGHIRR